MPLTKSEFAICELLALHPAGVQQGADLRGRVFGYDGAADDSAITEHIKNIRAKLRAAGADAGAIETVWGIGYRWRAG